MDKSKVAILGSTGSIGQNTLNVIMQHPDRFEVIALSAFQSVELLFAQCAHFKPQYAVMVDESAAAKLKDKLAFEGLTTIVLSGSEGLCFIAALPEVDKVVAAIVGGAGLMSTLSAVDAGKQILLANKESLIMAGDFLLERAKNSGSIFLPVDSEHNALFQCLPSGYLPGERPQNINKLILTASGGAFLNHTPSQLQNVTPEQACVHPNWKMGKKITVDSATLMNKGLEVIEACRLFKMRADEVEVVIHPQSIIHSLVEYQDGSFLAQLGVPDMRIPIAYCLAWPERIPSGAKRLSLPDIGQLTFFKPENQFPCLNLAYAALEQNELTIVLNASNEIAVSAFLNKEIRFTDIPYVIEKTLSASMDISAHSLEAILEIDNIARNRANACIAQKQTVMNL